MQPRFDSARSRRCAALFAFAAVAGLFAGAVMGADGERADGASSKDTHAAIVTIKDEINDVTLISMKRRIDQSREAGATVIVLELDTPGGLVSSALDICTYLKNLTDLKTIAWVRPSAFSAGSMIALACDEVVMTSASKMGDCAPIIISATEGLKELGKTERAKVESPILKEFRDSAHRRGYDALMCESMVRLGNEIWWIENGPGGERKFALTDEKEELVDEEQGAWQLVETITNTKTGEEYDLPQPVVEEHDLLTLTQTEAVAFGFAKAIIDNENELKSYYGLADSLARTEPNWSEALADFLSSPIVRMLLMMLIALGVYAEFQAPGHFVGGSVALVALIIFVAAPYLTGLADGWEILLIVFGAVLLAIELFVIPGFGIAGILGIMLIFVGFIATFVPAEPGPVWIPQFHQATTLGLMTGLKVTFGGLGLGIVGMWILNRYLPRIPGVRGLILSPASETAIGGQSGGAFTMIESPPVSVGDAGKAVTTLRPAGKARINGRRVDVIAQGTVIEGEAEIEVIEVSGGRVVVREITKA
ncbi:MAG: hypothetical protein O7D94_06190 [Planctomycetota bacterium]|nr:hypothetical protein [Planctomycetota bacterium]